MLRALGDLCTAARAGTWRRRSSSWSCFSLLRLTPLVRRTTMASCRFTFSVATQTLRLSPWASPSGSSRCSTLLALSPFACLPVPHRCILRSKRFRVKLILNPFRPTRKAPRCEIGTDSPRSTGCVRAAPSRPPPKRYAPRCSRQIRRRLTILLPSTASRPGLWSSQTLRYIWCAGLCRTHSTRLRFVKSS